MKVLEHPRPDNSVSEENSGQRSPLGQGRGQIWRRHQETFWDAGLFCILLGVGMAGGYAFVKIHLRVIHFFKRKIILKGWKWAILQLFLNRTRQLQIDLKNKQGAE